MVEDLQENAVEVRNAKGLLADHIKVKKKAFQINFRFQIKYSYQIEKKRNSRSTRRSRSSIKIC
jgi:hypothetical protein